MRKNKFCNFFTVDFCLINYFYLLIFKNLFIMKKVTLVLAVILFAVGGVFSQNPEIIYDSAKGIVVIGNETYTVGQTIPDSYGSKELKKEYKTVGEMNYYEGLQMIFVELYFINYEVSGSQYTGKESKWRLSFNNLTSAEEQITVEVGGEKIEFIFQSVEMIQKKE